MGIPGLWEEVQAFGKDVALPRLHESFSVRAGEQIRVGIDVSAWIVHGCKLVGVPHAILRTIYARLCRLLQLPYLQPVFVFDGQRRPEFKRGKSTNDAAWTESKVQRYAGRVKELIAAFGFVYIDAPGEAEAELASLSKGGKIDAVLSDDADCLAFGALVVVRNWSSALSGNLARSAFLLKQRGTTPLSASSDDDEGIVVSSQQPPTDPAFDREELQKKENLTTIFRTCDLPKGLNADGCILVAILSGGDYNASGVENCGAKTAIALAKAGFGDRLVAGAREHLAGGSSSQSDPEWRDFIAAWRTDVLEELKTNKSGFMSTRKPKLAKSAVMLQLMDSDASRRLLATYVWPVITPIEKVELEVQSPPDVSRIAALLSSLLDWSSESTLQSLRTSVWSGCLMQHHVGRTVAALHSGHAHATPSSTSSESSKKKAGLTMKDYLRKETVSDRGAAENEPDYAPIKVLRERKHPSTAGLPEIYVEVQVAGLAKEAQGGVKGAHIDAELQQLRSLPERYKLATPVSSQGTTRSPSVSPRKKREPIDPMEPLRCWVSLAAIVASKEGEQAVEQYERQQRAMSEVKARKTAKSALGKEQKTLNSFFSRSVPKPFLVADSKIAAISGSTVKQPASAKGTKSSPSKRRAGSSPRGSIDEPASTMNAHSNPALEHTKRLARPSSPSPVRRDPRAVQPIGHITISDDSDDDDIVPLPQPYKQRGS